MSPEKANRLMLTKLAVFALAMFGFGFALVPFYNKICEVTGLNDLLQADTLPKNTQVDESRWVNLEFDANARGLPWQFAPLTKSMRVHPGQMVQVVYEVKNDSDFAITGQAIPSYGPTLAAQYVKKLECFCFSKQVVNPREVKKMPVQLVIDPGLPADVNTVTLSYTFFELGGTGGKSG